MNTLSLVILQSYLVNRYLYASIMANNDTSEMYYWNWQNGDAFILEDILYITVGLVTFFVNALIFVAIISYKQTHENYLVLIASLNFSDVLVGLSLLLGPTRKFVDFDACGLDVLAHGTFVTYFSTVVSQWHTVALSIDRWIAVHFALNCYSIMTPFHLKLLVAATWIIGSVETLVFALLQYFVGCFWDYNRWYEIIYALPLGHLVLIFAINAGIYGKLWNAAGRQRRQVAELQQQQNNPKGVNKATAIVALFGLLWAPVIIGRIIQIFVDGTFSDRINMALHYSALFGCSNSIINCIVYAFFNKNLRSSIVRRLKCLTCSC